MPKKPENLVSFKELENVTDISLEHQVAYYIECDNENYHSANILGMGIYDGTNAYYVKGELVRKTMEYISDIPKYTYDLKKNMVLLDNLNIQ